MAGFFQRLFAGSPPKIATIKPFGVELEVGGSQTLLEAALASGVAFPHNCTVGTCGSCKCLLVSGKVGQITDFGYTLSKEELQAGYILACQATLKTPVTVVVESQAENIPAPEQFTGQIIASRDLTHDIREITINLDRPIRYLAGQYANLVAPGLPGRSYSFATGPERNGKREVKFFIRKIPGGAFTEKLFAGALDTVELAIDGPHGTFYLRPGEAPIICIAGGSGLAPLLSLLQDARKNRIRRNCVLLFGARTEADLYALDEIAEIAADWPAGFTFVPVLSHEAATSSWSGARGFVTEAVAHHLPDGERGQFQGYMCGPPAMIDAAIAALTALGIPLSSIHYDKFTDSRPVGAGNA